MKLFGRESLRQAHAITEAAYIAKEHEQRKQELEDKKTKLARLLFRETVAAMDPTYNGIDMKPVDNHKQRRKFVSSLDLAKDFEVNRLLLRAKGDRISGWMEYELGYAQASAGRSNSYESVSEFRAQNEDYASSADLPDSETLLWQRTSEASPIGFESEEYRFVRSVAGLFLPQVISELEKEGL